MTETMDYLLLIPVACIILGVIGAFFVLKMQKATTMKVKQRALSPELLATGIPSQARVISASDTGMEIDGLYLLVKLELEVEATTVSSGFITEITVPLSPVKVADFAEGRTISVKVDDTRKQVAIDQPID